VITVGDRSLFEVSFVKVRDVIRALDRDGWVQVRQRGSHRQFRHPTKPGTTTVAGARGVDVPPRTLASIRRQSGWKER